MKRLFTIILMAMPLMAVAQSEWEVPDAQKQQKKEQKVKQDVNEVITEIDPKYAEGTVPLVDGKPEWETTIKVQNCKADELYKRTMDALSEMTQQPNQHSSSRLTAVNKAEHIIAAYYDEELLLKRQAIAKDVTDFRYTIIAKVTDDEVNVRLCRISYAYDLKRGGRVYPGEELLTDENAMNKKHTKFYPLTGKFRIKTIDRKDEIFEFIEQKVK